MNPSIEAALIGAASLWALQLIFVLVWAVMIEMRLRSCEATCKEMRDVRDTVLALKSEFGFFREDLNKLTSGLKWLNQPPYDPEAGTRRQRRAPPAETGPRC